MNTTETIKLMLDALEKHCTPYRDGTHPADEAIQAGKDWLERGREPVAWRHDMGEENGGWEYFEEASCPDCQPLYKD